MWHARIIKKRPRQIHNDRQAPRRLSCGSFPYSQRQACWPAACRQRAMIFRHAALVSSQATHCGSMIPRSKAPEQGLRVISLFGCPPKDTRLISAIWKALKHTVFLLEQWLQQSLRTAMSQSSSASARRSIHAPEKRAEPDQPFIPSQKPLTLSKKLELSGLFSALRFSNSARSSFCFVVKFTGVSTASSISMSP